MATYNLAPGEHLVQCPYNKSHLIINTKELMHLDRCRRAHKKDMANQGKSVEIVACRFNYSHQCPKIELDYHHRNCPDQHKIVDHIKYHDTETFHEVKPDEDTKESRGQSTSSQEGFDHEEEDWDSQSRPEPGYDPSKKLNTDNILYMPPGLSKSERKAYRKKLSQKFRESDATSQTPSHMCRVEDIEREMKMSQ